MSRPQLIFSDNCCLTGSNNSKLLLTTGVTESNELFLYWLNYDDAATNYSGLVDIHAFIVDIGGIDSSYIGIADMHYAVANDIIKEPVFFRGLKPIDSASTVLILAPLTNYAYISNSTRPITSYLICEFSIINNSELINTNVYHLKATTTSEDMYTSIFLNDACKNYVSGKICLVRPNHNDYSLQLAGQYLFKLACRGGMILNAVYKNSYINSEGLLIQPGELDSYQSSMYVSEIETQPVNVYGIIQYCDAGNQTVKYITYLCKQMVTDIQYLETIPTTKVSDDKITFSDFTTINIELVKLVENQHYYIYDSRAYIEVGRITECTPETSYTLTSDDVEDIEINYEKGFEQTVNYI